MATWGEFIAEIPIINKRSEGIFVKADHVLDLWEERNKLRAELATLKAPATEAEPAGDLPTAPSAAPVADEGGKEAAARERECCAQEVEEFAQTCPVDPTSHEFAVQLLQAAAQHLREKPSPEGAGFSPEGADFLDQVVIPPAAETAPSAEATSSEAVPMAEPVADELPPMAEPVADDLPPMAEPVADDVPPMAEPVTDDQPFTFR